MRGLRRGRVVLPRNNERIMKRRYHYSLSVPAIKKLREAIEKGDISRWLIESGEKSHAGKVIVKYTLKKRPWVLTIEAKRMQHGSNAT